MAVAPCPRDNSCCRSRSCDRRLRCIRHQHYLLPLEAMTPLAAVAVVRCHRRSCSRRRIRASSARRPSSCGRLLGCRGPWDHRVSPPSRSRPRSRGPGRHSIPVQQCKRRRLTTERCHRDANRLEQPSSCNLGVDQSTSGSCLKAQTRLSEREANYTRLPLCVLQPTAHLGAVLFEFVLRPAVSCSQILSKVDQ